MTRYSLIEAQLQLPELIDRVRRGEGVTITDGGVAVAELKAANDAGAETKSVDVSWLEQRLIGRADPQEDAGALLSRMRDEEAARF
jgi:antitoxin (DNA-binding transcriptional repressor) of toxin-antitoxin stability system